MTATDQFYTYAPNLASPAVGAFTIVPHDTNGGFYDCAT